MSDDDVVTHDDAKDSAWETAQEDLVVIGALTEALRATGTPTELARTDETSAAFIATRNAHAGAAPVAASVRTPAHAAAPRPFGRAAAVLAAAVASVLLVGGVASAATGSLPEPLQRFAHTVIGAPAPQPQAAADVTNTPSAAGPTEAQPTVELDRGHVEAECDLDHVEAESDRADVACAQPGSHRSAAVDDQRLVHRRTRTHAHGGPKALARLRSPAQGREGQGRIGGDLLRQGQQDSAAPCDQAEAQPHAHAHQGDEQAQGNGHHAEAQPYPLGVSHHGEVEVEADSAGPHAHSQRHLTRPEDAAPAAWDRVPDQTISGTGGVGRV